MGIPCADGCYEERGGGPVGSLSGNHNTIVVGFALLAHPALRVCGLVLRGSGSILRTLGGRSKCLKAFSTSARCSCPRKSRK